MIIALTIVDFSVSSINGLSVFRAFRLVNKTTISAYYLFKISEFYYLASCIQIGAGLEDNAVRGYINIFVLIKPKLHK